MTNSSHDAPSKPLLHKREWNSIQELIGDETKLMAFKSIHDFGPKYMYKMFTRNSLLTERILRNTTSNLRLPLRKSTVGQKSFSYRQAKVPRCGIAYQLSAKKQDHYMSLNPF